ALRRHQARMLAEGNRAADWMFCDTEGELLWGSNFRRSFQPLLRKAEVPAVPFHSLRHTCATLLLQDGENIKAIQERLGHATLLTTMQNYLHITEQMEQATAGRTDRMFSRA